MSLLNNSFPILECYAEPNLRFSSQSTPSIGLAALMKKFTIENDMWYCMITNDRSLTSFSFLELIGEQTLLKIKNKTAYLVVDLPFEPFLNCIDAVYEELVNKLDIPPSQIIFMSNMFDALDYNNSLAKKLGYDPIRVFYFSSLEYTLNLHIYHNLPLYNNDYPKSLERKKYQKSFLNFNRRWRLHRPLLVLLMYYYKLLDKGYVSFGPSEQNHNWDHAWRGLLHNVSDSPELVNIVLESKSIIDLPPLYLDTERLDINMPQHSRSTDYFYENSYFSVVSETTFYYKNSQENSRFITEKTFKAIAMKHPFLLVTIPNSLNVLKKIGYKTFSPWIDESYDQEFDDHKRMLMIVREIDRLSNLSIVQLKDFIDNCKEICDHNFRLLRCQKNFVYTEDWNAL